MNDLKAGGEDIEEAEGLPGVDYAAIDAILARSAAAIERAKKPYLAATDPLVYDRGWMSASSAR